jgi:hypothetical protein
MNPPVPAIAILVHRARHLAAGLVLLTLLHVPSACAQLLPEGVTERVPFFAAALTPLLAEPRPFTARAHWIFFADSPEERTQVPMTLAMSGGQMRWDLNLEESPREQFLPGALPALKQMKMDKISLYLQPNRAVQVTFPGAESVVVLPLPKDQRVVEKAGDQAAQLTQTAVGRETIDGHVCVKFRLLVPAGKTTTAEAYVWRATDLENFPLRLQIRFGTESHVLQFKQPNFAKIEPAQLVPPAKFKRFADLETLMQSNLLRGLGLGQ